MITLKSMVMRQFFPVFIVTIIFFVMILQLGDLFKNLFQYINNDIPAKSIFYVSLLYFPKCISYALPISLLFTVSFTLGNLYANNELIAIFGSGISLFRFVTPFLITGIILCFISFLFDDYVVIPTYKKKESISLELMGLKPNNSNTKVTIISGNGNIIYNIDYYNNDTKTMANILVIERDMEGMLISRLDAESAKWEDGIWNFKKCRFFSWDKEHKYLEEKSLSSFSDPDYNEEPDTFKKKTRKVDEMSIKDAKLWIQTLKRAGLPYKEALTDYYVRYTFSLTPFIVVIISCALGGKFKKNILLMSLLSSLVLSVVYFVIQMITEMMAKLGTIPPFAGASASVIFFLFIGFWLFRTAKT
ncbi:MAG: YjgP/YjgQ family permease [Deltaproteobacteria bacterium]|nr:YjgP/YjgQ family permease [Deltaproteobacteria bacterium]